MWCLVVFQDNFHDQYLPQVKGKLFLEDMSVSKEFVYICVHLHRITQNKYPTV